MGNEEFTIGAVVREPGSTRRNKTGRWRVFRPELDQEKCVNCGMCFMYCPDGCIRPSDDGYTIDYDYCKGCGICESVCPVDAIEMVLEEG
ncbi:pyruvate synthase subunit PorD [Methanopyrus sp. KOL6]|uniref:pyruvate synthase subunit PorD n=1 Tax=Methanopyrus sp. KOL6 TaxID=1937004 RepID=UPI000B4A67D8|nr:pyruvate synthase subunit PorD [Methanopyrus sp. KOL6]